MKPVRVVVIESTTRPGKLSFRLRPGDPTGTPVLVALTESGAKPGDVLEIRLVRTNERTPDVD